MVTRSVLGGIKRDDGDDDKYFNVDISNNQIELSAHNFGENHQKSLS